VYFRSTRAPRRHRISYGIVPIHAAISLASIDVSPCDPEEDNLVSRTDAVDVGDVHREHVHADSADDLRALTRGSGRSRDSPAGDPDHQRNRRE
jgi:hypothetical protein